MATQDIISRQEAINRIATFCDGLLRRGGRTPSAYTIRDGLISAIRGIHTATGSCPAPQEKPSGNDLDTLPLETRETTERVITREPFIRGSRIGTEVYRCGTCRTQVYGRDRFCRGCGRELVKTDRKVDDDGDTGKGVV